MAEREQQQVLLSQEMLTLWADELIPGDIWYWDDSPLELELTGCRVMTREEYRSDPGFNTIRYMNAYLEWLMPPEATNVIASSPRWIDSLGEAERLRVLQKQVELNRGLVFAADWFGEIPAQLEGYVVGDQVVLGQDVWASLPRDVQHRVLIADQRRWEEVDCFPAPDSTPEHVREVANTFSPHEGTNCFAIALYGATAVVDLLSTWVTSPPLELIEPLGYRHVPNTRPTTDDIVMFLRDGKITHACWCIEPDRFLNKNGQARVSPIRIVDWHMLTTEWPNHDRVVYRRNDP